MDKVLKIKDLREKTVEELKSLLLNLSQENFKLRLKRSASGEIKSHRFKQVKKLVAQIKTLLNEQESVK